MTDTRLRVVLIAPTADGNDVGEAWSCFRWVAGLAERHDVTVLSYHKRDRTPLARQLPHVRVVEWSDLPIVGRFERFNSMAKPGQLAFRARARHWLRQAIAAGQRFDLIHQLAPLALRYPTPALGLGIPWVMGPVGGSLDTPPGMLTGGGTGGGKPPWFVGLRRLDRLRLRLPGALRASYEGAALVLAVAPYVREILTGLELRRIEYESETGIPDLPTPRTRVTARPGHLRLLYVGRLIRTKGLFFGLGALARLRDLPEVTLDVAGDGEDRAACEALVRDVGLLDRVRFHGKVPRERVEELYREADAFLFPSYREPSGNVVFESMRHGLPVIAARAGGPGHVVDERCGRLVDPTDPTSLVTGIEAAMRELAADPALVARLGASARARVATLALWPAKIARVEALWHQVIDGLRRDSRRTA